MKKGSHHTPESLAKMSTNRKGKACGDKNAMSNTIFRDKARLGVQESWNKRDAPYKNRNWLHDQYINQRKSIIQIAKELNVNYVTIYNWLIKFDIEIRGNCPENSNYKNYDWIYDQYINKSKTIHQISLELDVSPTVIWQWLNRFNIPIRSPIEWISGDKNPMKRDEVVSKISGKNSYKWNGGSSKYPYCEKWTENLKSRIRLFFDNRCLLCGKSQEDNGQKLSCHHVEYNKSTCCDDSIPMFASLCRSCHNKTSATDRNRWSYMISYIIQEVYDGKSYFTKDEIGQKEKNNY